MFFLRLNKLIEDFVIINICVVVYSLEIFLIYIYCIKFLRKLFIVFYSWGNGDLERLGNIV